MLYEQAKAALSEGKKVRRSDWRPNLAIEIIDGNFSWDGGKTNWQPTNEDATAKDWETTGGKKEATEAEKIAGATMVATSTNNTTTPTDFGDIDQSLLTPSEKKELKEVEKEEKKVEAAEKAEEKKAEAFDKKAEKEQEKIQDEKQKQAEKVAEAKKK